MNRRLFVNRNKVYVLIAFLVVGFTSSAQPDCRSILGAHYTPVGESGLSWSVEGTLAGGIMPDRQIANWSVYGGLDYTRNKFQVYFEGAYKDWYNSAKNPDGEEPQSTMPNYNKPTRYNWGMREAFIKYGDENFYIKPGVQGVKSIDYLLIDERMLGVTAYKNLGLFELTGHLGTVNQRMARFQDVCGNRHIYNIVHRSQYNFVSENIGETNLAGVFLTWNPNSKVAENRTDLSSGSDDEFESFDEFAADEFSSDEFSGSEVGDDTGNAFQLSELGLLYYQEFGSFFHEYKYYFGAFGKVEMPFGVKVKAELVDQYIVNDHALALLLNFDKTATWGSGASSLFEVGYLHKFDIDENAHFYPAFTNLFKGEIMRLDAIDLPLVYGTYKHFFPGANKVTLQLNGVMQASENQSKEVDVIAGVKLFGHARLSAIGSYVTSELLDDDYWMAKLELRLAF